MNETNNDAMKGPNTSSITEKITMDHKQINSSESKDEYEDTTVIVPSVTSETEMKLDEDDANSSFSLSVKISDLDDLTIDSAIKVSSNLQNDDMIDNPELIEEDDTKESKVCEKETQGDKNSVPEHKSDFPNVGKSLTSDEYSTKKDIDASMTTQNKETVSKTTETPSSFFQNIQKYMVFFLLLFCMVLIVSSPNMISGNKRDHSHSMKKIVDADISPTTSTLKDYSSPIYSKFSTGTILPEKEKVVSDQGQCVRITLREFVKNIFSWNFESSAIIISGFLCLIMDKLKKGKEKRVKKPYSKKKAKGKNNATQSRFKRFKRFPLDLKSIFMSRYKTEVVDNEGFLVEVTRSTRILNSPQGKVSKSQARILNSPKPNTLK